MPELPLNFRSRCLEAALNLLWRQWCSLGVAGHAVPAAEGRIIDPEVLLLATTSIGRHDPRLFDEALDWLTRFGSFINLQRLKNLSPASGLGDATVLAAVAGWLATHARQPKWKALAGRAVGETQALFGGTVPAETDPLFLAHGLARGPVKLRGMSRPPNPTLPPNLLFALRALIGVSARAEAILCLAGGAAAHAAEIARLTGYAPRTMQVLLQEMTLSGHVLTQEPSTASGGKIRKGPNRRYHLQSDDWAFLTGGRLLPQWMPWAPLFVLVQEVITCIPDDSQTARHPALISSRLREVLAAHGNELAAAGLLPALDLRSGAPGGELLATLAGRLPDVLDRL